MNFLLLGVRWSSIQISSSIFLVISWCKKKRKSTKINSRCVNHVRKAFRWRQDNVFFIVNRSMLLLAKDDNFKAEGIQNCCRLNFCKCPLCYNSSSHKTVKTVRCTSSEQWHNVYKYLCVRWTRPFLGDAAVIGKEKRGSTRALILSITGLQDPVQVTHLPWASVSYCPIRDTTHLRGMKKDNSVSQMMRHYKMQGVIYWVEN